MGILVERPDSINNNDKLKGLEDAGLTKNSFRRTIYVV